MITRKVLYFLLEKTAFFTPKNSDFLRDSFALLLPPLTERREQVLFEAPAALTLRIIHRSYTKRGEDHLSLCKEHCFYFAEEEWLLEAEARMQTPDRSRTVTIFLRLPLSAPFAQGELMLLFDGVRLAFLKDGALLNENYGLDAFFPAEGPIKSTLPTLKVTCQPKVTRCYREETSALSAGFYFPHGWNENVGDVMTFTHNGTYHLAYLADRRHHGSRDGAGAHAIHHLTTRDLLHWQEQEPIAAIDAPWISYGTGTMLFHQGKYYMVYGLHTERYGKDLAPILQDGCYERLTYQGILEQGLFPAGATYSTSEDGLHFTASNEVFHAARNPSTYTDQEGILLYGGYRGHGIFRAPSMDAPFRMVEATPIYDNGSLMKNSTECPAFFEWRGYRYLIVGFSGYYRTRTPAGEWFDAAAEGEEIYDGLSVPMVTSFGEDRRLIAGWISSPYGWGGALLQRELVSLGEGKLGMKWIPELTPEGTPEVIDLQQAVPLKNESCLLEVTVDPASSTCFALSLEEGDTACNLQFYPAEGRIQISGAPCGCFAEPLPTLREEYLQGAEQPRCRPHDCGDYALTDTDFMNRPFLIRLLLRRSRRLYGTVLDMEFAGRKTMISVRHDFSPTALRFLQEGDAKILSADMAAIDSAEQ